MAGSPEGTSESHLSNSEIFGAGRALRKDSSEPHHFTEGKLRGQRMCSRSHSAALTGWLSGLGFIPQSKGSPVRAHRRGDQSAFLTHIDVSLSLFLPPFPFL